jgi:RNA polymerase sigma factor (sigma-70 family)
LTQTATFGQYSSATNREARFMQRDSSAAILTFLGRILPVDGSDDCSDEVLLRRFVDNRDESAFGLLVRRHGPMVVGVLRRALRRAEDVEDGVQATFLALARKAAGLARPGLLANWLYGVARRAAAKLRVQAARRVAREEPLAREPCTVPATVREPDLLAALDDEIGRLPAKYRAPVVLCYGEGLTNEQAARRLGCPKGTLQSRLAWARNRLRTRLARRGLGTATAGAAWLAEQVAPAAVPCGLLDKTILAVRGARAAGAIGPAAVLARQVLWGLFVSRLRVAGTAVGLLLLLGAGAYWQTPAQKDASPPVPVALVNADGPGPGPAAGVQVATQVVRRSFRTANAPTVVVDMFNGDVDVVATDDDAVAVQVTKRGEGSTANAAEAAMKAMGVRADQQGDTVRVLARPFNDRGQEGSYGASADVRVPAAAKLDLRTLGGTVRIRGGRGHATVSMYNGAIVVEDHSGPLDLQTRNGPILVKGGRGRLDLRTINGPIDVQAERARITARTTNAAISFRGTLVDGRHSFETTNGDIAITLPADAQFEVDASAPRGRIGCAFHLDQPDQTGDCLRGATGTSPETLLRLRSSAAAISVRKQG